MWGGKTDSRAEGGGMSTQVSARTRPNGTEGRWGSREAGQPGMRREDPEGKGEGGGGLGRRDEESEMYGRRKKAKPRGHPGKQNSKMAGGGQGRRDGETELLDTREMDVDSEDPWLTRMR
jgi:hypothetical protein